jgi:hypothetical protein
MPAAYRIDLTRVWTRAGRDAQALEVQCRAMIERWHQAVAARCGW